jgi:hypothetical protein
LTIKIKEEKKMTRTIERKIENTKNQKGEKEMIDKEVKTDETNYNLQ